MTPKFKYQRRVAYADTDAMGVVHHANYVRYFEETRVAWMRESQLAKEHAPHADVTFALLHCDLDYHRYLQFDDLVTIRMQVRTEGLKIHFAYAIFCPERWGEDVVCTGRTTHIAVNSKLKPVRLGKNLKDVLENEAWNETWPSSLSASPKRQP